MTGTRAAPDKSPRVANTEEVTRRAEISNYDIVAHWFGLAADRLGLADDLRAVLQSSYREVQVQVPVKLSDGRSTSTRASGCSTTARAGRTRAASATTPRSTSTRCARSPRS